jgi:long-chain acyl-CoA synthetase
MNIAQNIERSSDLFPNKPAIIFEGKYFTYKDLNEKVNQAANALQKLGIKSGNCVALLLPNIPKFIISYLSIQKIGAIAVSMNTSLKRDEVKFILEDSQSIAIITTETLFNNVPQTDLPHLQHIVIAEGSTDTAILLSDIMSQSSPIARATSMSPSDPAAILYTSGTTGFPKGATLSHGNVISNMYSMNHNCGMGTQDKILLFLPMFHCFGQNAILNSAINACATIVLHRTFEPEAVLASVADYDITMFFGVPTTFILLLDRADKNDLTARYYFSAAAGLPVEIAKKWQEKFGIVINQGYGLTETSPLASYNHYLKFKPGSIGSPIENVEMKIVELENGNEVAPGELGEIIIRGVNVMLGYWNRPTETAKVIKNGWFHTGDIGTMDESGYFYIVDRLKDMINTGGQKVYPAEVENVIYQHPSVAEVAVYGIADTLMGEQIRASIILKPNQVVTEEEIIAFCYQRMAQFKVPSAIEFVATIPKNPTGKVLKRLLREENSLSNVSNVQSAKATLEIQQPSLQQISTPTIESIEYWITDWLMKKLSLTPNAIDPNKSFADYGLDSVRAVNLAQDLSHSLELSLLPTITWNFSTIASLARHLANKNISQSTDKIVPATISQPKQQTENLVDASSNQDLQTFSDEELAKLINQEIALFQQRK